MLDESPSLNLVEIIALHAKFRKNRTALICGERKVTWSDLNVLVDIPCRHRRASLNTTETNRRIAEQFKEAFNRSDLDGAASCFTEDCENHGRKVGRAGVRTVLGEIKTNFPDAKLTTLNSVAEGEWVVVRCTYGGTHRGTSHFPVDGGMLVGVQPTGRTFEVQHIHMYRVLDGKIAEHFANRDDVGMMRQLGLLPPPPSLSGR